MFNFGIGTIVVGRVPGTIAAAVAAIVVATGTTTAAEAGTTRVLALVRGHHMVAEAAAAAVVVIADQTQDHPADMVVRSVGDRVHQRDAVGEPGTLTGMHQHNKIGPRNQEEERRRSMVSRTAMEERMRMGEITTAGACRRRDFYFLTSLFLNTAGCLQHQVQ